MSQPHDFKETLVGPARDVLAGSARGLTRLLGSAGTGAVAATPATVRSRLAGVLTSLDQLPSATDEVEVVVAEVHAMRLSLQAMQAELDALDRQLAVLEKALAPVWALSHQMSRLRRSLDEALGQPPEIPDEPGLHDARPTRPDEPSGPGQQRTRERQP